MSYLKNVPLALLASILVAMTMAILSGTAEAQRSTPVTVVNSDPIPVAVESSDYRVPVSKMKWINHGDSGTWALLPLNGRTFVLKDVTVATISWNDQASHIVFSVDDCRARQVTLKATFDGTRSSETFHFLSGVVIRPVNIIPCEHVELSVMDSSGDSNFVHSITIAGYLID